MNKLATINKGGRPTKLTPGTMEKLADCLSNNLSIQQSCMIAGISPTTYYKHYNGNEGFRMKMDVSAEQTRINARTTIADAIKNGSAKASMYVLDRTDPEFKGNNGPNTAIQINVTRGNEQ